MEIKNFMRFRKDADEKINVQYPILNCRMSKYPDYYLANVLIVIPFTLDIEHWTLDIETSFSAYN